eukprot:554007-Alexandrium_andersonii.AAC.1
MSASLVGSEMCIRDRFCKHALEPWLKIGGHEPEQDVPTIIRHSVRGCVPPVHNGLVWVIEG